MVAGVHSGRAVFGTGEEGWKGKNGCGMSGCGMVEGNGGVEEKQVHMCVCIRARAYVFVYVFAYMYVYMFVYECIDLK